MSLPNIVIVTGAPFSLNPIKALFMTLPSARWLYCGKDIPFSTKLGNALGENRKIGIGNDLQETAREFRQDYIDFIGKITQSIIDDPARMSWYLSSISEKNPFITNVFLYFCYTKVCQQILKTCDNDLIIISESPALSKALYMNLYATNRCNVSLADGGDFSTPARIWLWLHSAVKRVWFFWVYFTRIFLARLFLLLSKKRRNRNGKQNKICIHSFTDKRSITDPRHYQHIYFRNMGPDLTKESVPFFYLTDVLPTTSYLSVIRQLLHYPEDCRLSEEFITISDLFSALRIIKNTRGIHIAGLPLGGIRMEEILAGEMERDTINTRREEAYLRFCTGKRIASEGQHIPSFIYIFENHIWEKMFCLAFRQYSPKTTLVGYAHTIVNTMYTCYSVSSYELGILPLPDIIVVNGVRAKQTLEMSGFSGKKIIITGALRYQHMDKKKFVPKGHKETTVLVALSIGINDSIELIHKVFAALGDKKGICVLLKCHPTTPFSIISRYISSIPANVQIRHEPIESLLPDSDVLLYAESTVCVEALAMGVPVINVKSDHRIDMNIFEGIGAIPSVSTPAELEKAVWQVTPQPALDKFNAIQGIVDEIFAPLRQDYLTVLFGKK